MSVAIAFVVIAAILCVAALFALLAIAHVRLSGADAIERDGLSRGESAPSWRLTDQDGLARVSPPAQLLQLIIFADHSLKSFPSVVTGLRALVGDPDLEIVILTRGSAGHAAPVLAALGLAGTGVLNGSAELYARYNVRVMPFAIFVDSGGRARASSLVNHDWQLAKLRQVAAIPLAERSARGRRPAVMAG